MYEHYTDCTTGADGKCCVPTPDPLADPTDAPTVDPIGGGSTGGGLAVGTWRAAVSYLTHYGETRLSPTSADFQVGIPDANVSPTLAAPVYLDTLPAAGGSLAVGTYYAVVLYTDGAGHTNLETVPSGAIICSTLGDVPRLTVPSLSLRPNAVDFSVYLGTSTGGPFHLYQSGLTTTSPVPLTAAYNSGAAETPLFNTSLKAIPRVTYTPGVGTTADHVWAINATSGAGFWKAATASPVDLTPGFTSQAIPAANSTGHGRFRITCDPPLCSPKETTVTVGSACVNVGFDFGPKTIAFDLVWGCCAPLSPQVELFNGTTSLGTCVPVRFFEQPSCLFDVSDQVAGTVLDWVFTDAHYPTQSGTVVVPECGTPDAHYVGTLRLGDVTITLRLADVYPTLTLTTPIGSTVTLAAQADGSFTGSEVIAWGADVGDGHIRHSTVTYRFNPAIADSVGGCNPDQTPGTPCGLVVGWPIQFGDTCENAADDAEIAAYGGGTVTLAIRYDVGATQTTACWPLLFTWSKSSQLFGVDFYIYDLPIGTSESWVLSE